jgi:hypothetical protein
VPVEQAPAPPLDTMVVKKFVTGFGVIVVARAHPPKQKKTPRIIFFIFSLT